MTASASAAAAFRPLGPPAAIQTGTSRMSYQSPLGSRNSISVSWPCHRWVTRSPRRSPRMTSTEWTSSPTVAGRLPMDRRALFAVPMPRNVRPGASLFKVAIEFAVTGAIRVSGLVTIVPRLIVDVCWRRQRHLLVRVGEQQRALAHAEVGHAQVLGLADQVDLVDLGARADAEIHVLASFRSGPGRGDRSAGQAEACRAVVTANPAIQAGMGS